MPPETAPVESPVQELNERLDALKRTRLNGHATAQYLSIRSIQRPLDTVARDALIQLEDEYVDGVDVAAATREYELKKMATPLAKVSRRLDAMSLPWLTRRLLSNPRFYVFTIQQLGLNAKELPVAVQDTVGFTETLLRRLEAPDQLVDSFYKILVTTVAANEGVRVTDVDALVRRFRDQGPSFAPGTVTADFRAAHQAMLRRKNLPELVDLFASEGEIDEGLLTHDVRDRMVEYLLSSGINLDTNQPEVAQRVLNHGYDEYFALAYEHARAGVNGAGDAIPATGGWNFSVDTFDVGEDQAVDADNILAAGFLYYAYQLGEALDVFDLMDTLYLEWERGMLDLPQSEVATTLEHLWQDRERRQTAEERAMGYRKALGLGDAQTLSRAVVNEDFARLWGRLMEVVANYIAKREDVAVTGSERSPVSRVPIYLATKQLQYNLTEYANGRTKAQATRLRALLSTCFDVLSSKEIVEAYGTPQRKDVWTVIERLHRLPPRERVPNISSIRTAAVRGNEVFQFIAGFDQATVTDAEFDRFIEAAEGWIIAVGEMPQGEESFQDDGFAEDDFEEDFEEDFDEDFEEKALEDEFDDF